MATALTTLASLKSFLGITDVNAQRDALLASLITQCSAQVENFCQRVLGSQQYVEYCDGTGLDYVVPSQYPITAVDSLEVNGQAVPAAATPQQAGYMYEDRAVFLALGQRIARGRRNVKLTYTAGYTTIPAELELVVNKIIANTYKGKDWIGFASKSLAGETVSFRDEIDKPSQRAVLQNFRNVVPTR